MSERFCDLPRSARLYRGALFCLSTPVFVWAIPISHPLIVMWLIVIFAVACAVKPIPYPYGGIVHPISGIVQVASILFDPQDAFLGVGVGCFLGLLGFGRTELWRSGTNAEGWAMGTLAAGVVAHLTLTYITFIPLSLPLATILSCGARFVTNQIIFSGYRSLRFGHPFLPHLRYSLGSGFVGELFPMPMIIILAGMAFLLPSTAWRLVITASYLPVLPIPRRRGYHSAARGLNQTTMAITSKVPLDPSAVLQVGARILSAAEQYDNTCATLNPALRSGAPEAVECQLAVRLEGAPDPLITPIIMSVGNELRSALADKSA